MVEPKVFACDDENDGNDSVMTMLMNMTNMVKTMTQVTGKFKSTGKRQSMSKLAIDGFGEILSNNRLHRQNQCQ